MNKTKKLILTRDSVGAGDDISAPHTKIQSLNIEKGIISLMKEAKEKYLPSNIQGGKATWLAQCNKKSIAIIAQEWSEPRIIDKNIKIENLLNDNGDLLIFFIYLSQDDPENAYNQHHKIA